MYQQGRYFMEFQDRTLVCKDCGKEFTFTAGEQEFYKEKGFETVSYTHLTLPTKLEV